MKKTIEFGDGKYSVSTDGFILNKHGRKLKGNDIGKGYLQVTLSHNGYRKSFLIHRLVAEAFKSNPKNLNQVNHKDLNPSNNKASNLEWVDGSSNVQHSYDMGRKPSCNSTRRKLDDLQVRVIRSLRGHIPIKQMARYFNANRTTIRLV